MALPKLPFKGVCDSCDTERWIVKRKPPLCQYCNAKRLNDKRKQRLGNNNYNGKKRTSSGEGVLFYEIWNDTHFKDRVSFVTGKPLPDRVSARSFYFSHVLPKGKYPKFRLKKENIVFMTFEEHQLWEFAKHKIRDKDSWKHVFELENKLKEEYYK